MRKDVTDIGRAARRPADDQAGNRPRRVGRILEHLRGDTRHEIGTARRVRRVNVDDGAAAIELVEHRRKDLVAQPLVAVAREETYAIDLQGIEGVFDLAKAAVDVRQRQHRKEPESALVRAHQAAPSRTR